jgi:glutamate-1-semialdehyde 2,1-aminomutase
MKTENSKILYERALKSITSGVNSNSRFRSPHPIYFKRGEGAFLYDIDGNKYIDIILGNGAIFFGHNFKPFTDRFKQLNEEYCGLTTGVESELGVLAAEKFLRIIPADKVRFTNTGTEAILHVMHIARAYTGKNDFALVEGSYNGWVDHVNVSTFPSIDAVGEEKKPNSVPGMGGLDKQAVQSSVVVPFNDIETTKKLLIKNKDRLAAFILEPIMIDVGYIEPKPEYLKSVRQICDKLNILLVFDELLTGFRAPNASCQKNYGIDPDLSIFGKAIANGNMLAAVSGKTEIMDTAKVGGKANFVGTFNGHQISLAACLATLELMEDGKILKHIDDSTLYLSREFEKLAQKHSVSAKLNGRGGHFHFYFSEKEVKNYRDAALCNQENYLTFSNKMNSQGIYMINKYLSHHALSYSHNEEVLEKIVNAFDIALAETVKTSNNLGCE